MKTVVSEQNSSLKMFFLHDVSMQDFQLLFCFKRIF